MTKTLPLFIFLLCIFSLNAQNDKLKYREIDSLIANNSMIDAMSALKKLDADFKKDTTKSDYWVRHSKASFTFYKYEDAKKDIEKAIRLDKGNSEVYFEKGLLLNKIGEPENSLDPLTRAIKIESKGKYRYWRAIVYQQLKENDSAEVDYKKAIEASFETAELYNNYSILLVEKGLFEQALAAINRAIQINSNYPQAFSARSKIHFFLLDIDSACIDKNIAQSMDYRKIFDIPENICKGTKQQKIQYAAEALAQLKFYKRSADAFTKLIDMRIDSSDYYLNRGYCYFQIKEYTKAETDYMKALTLPNSAKDLLYDNLSLLYYNENNFKKSLEYSTKRIELNPLNHVPYIDAGLCYRKLKNYKEAEKYFNESLKIKPDFYRAFGYRSYLFYELGQYEKARADAQQSVDISNNYGYGYLVLGLVKQQLGMPDFCIDFYKAKKFGEPDGEKAVAEFCK